MKKHTFYWRVLLVTTGILGTYANTMACDACKAQQPKFLQGVTHGPGPSSNWDYVVVSSMLIVTIYSFYALVKCLAKPAEKKHDSIKTMILNS